jgi:hypothetical protein
LPNKCGIDRFFYELLKVLTTKAEKEKIERNRGKKLWMML